MPSVRAVSIVMTGLALAGCDLLAPRRAEHSQATSSAPHASRDVQPIPSDVVIVRDAHDASETDEAVQSSDVTDAARDAIDASLPTLDATNDVTEATPPVLAQGPAGSCAAAVPGGAVVAEGSFVRFGLAAAADRLAVSWLSEKPGFQHDGSPRLRAQATILDARTLVPTQETFTVIDTISESMDVHGLTPVATDDGLFLTWCISSAEEMFDCSLRALNDAPMPTRFQWHVDAPRSCGPRGIDLLAHGAAHDVLLALARRNDTMFLGSRGTSHGDETAEKWTSRCDEAAGDGEAPSSIAGSSDGTFVATTLRDGNGVWLTHRAADGTQIGTAIPLSTRGMYNGHSDVAWSNGATWVVWPEREDTHDPWRLALASATTTNPAFVRGPAIKRNGSMTAPSIVFSDTPECVIVAWTEIEDAATTAYTARVCDGAIENDSLSVLSVPGAVHSVQIERDAQSVWAIWTQRENDHERLRAARLGCH